MTSLGLYGILNLGFNAHFVFAEIKDIIRVSSLGRKICLKR